MNKHADFDNTDSDSWDHQVQTQTEVNEPPTTAPPLVDTEDNLNREEKRRKWLLLLLSLLLLLLCGCLFLFMRYLQKPEPLPEMLLPQQVDYAPHYLFSIYGVDQPIGVALSPDGESLYVAESGGERLVKEFNRSGDPVNTLAPPRTTLTQRSPVYLSTDQSGRLFVSDRRQNGILVYDASGNYLDTILNPDLTLSEFVSKHTGGQLAGDFAYNSYEEYSYLYTNGVTQTLPAARTGALWAPLGVFVSPDNRLYVTDVLEEKHRVLEFDLPEDRTLLKWHESNEREVSYGAFGDGAGEFRFPNKAVIDSRGRVYITDGNNGRLVVFDSGGDEYLFSFGRGTGEMAVSLPRGLYIDQRDRLFVTDAVGQGVVVYDVTGDEPQFLYKFGDYGQDDGMFNYPNDIAVDASGRLYIADRENNRVQVWSY